MSRHPLLKLGFLLAVLAVTAPADSQPSPPTGVRLPAPVGAAWQYFVYVDGIPGDATEANHRGWITADTFSFGGNQTGTLSVGGGASTGKVNFMNVTFTHFADVASPKLFLQLSTARLIKEVRLDAQQAGGQPEVRVRLTDVIVQNMNVEGVGGRSRESVALSFAKIQYEVGAQKMGYDLKTMAPFTP